MVYGYTFFFFFYPPPRKLGGGGGWGGIIGLQNSILINK